MNPPVGEMEPPLIIDLVSDADQHERPVKLPDRATAQSNMGPQTEAVKPRFETVGERAPSGDSGSNLGASRASHHQGQRKDPLQDHSVGLKSDFRSRSQLQPYHSPNTYQQTNYQPYNASVNGPENRRYHAPINSHRFVEISQPDTLPTASETGSRTLNSTSTPSATQFSSYVRPVKAIRFQPVQQPSNLASSEYWGESHKPLLQQASGISKPILHLQQKIDQNQTATRKNDMSSFPEPAPIPSSNVSPATRALSEKVSPQSSLQGEAHEAVQKWRSAHPLDETIPCASNSFECMESSLGNGAIFRRNGDVLHVQVVNLPASSGLSPDSRAIIVAGIPGGVNFVMKKSAENPLLYRVWEGLKAQEPAGWEAIPSVTKQPCTPNLPYSTAVTAKKIPTNTSTLQRYRSKCQNGLPRKDCLAESANDTMPLPCQHLVRQWLHEDDRRTAVMFPCATSTQPQYLKQTRHSIEPNPWFSLAGEELELQAYILSTGKESSPTSGERKVIVVTGKSYGPFIIGDPREDETGKRIAYKVWKGAADKEDGYECEPSVFMKLPLEPLMSSRNGQAQPSQMDSGIPNPELVMSNAPLATSLLKNSLQPLRRPYSKIFRCDLEGCGHSYSSARALSNHQLYKHTGQTMTSSEYAVGKFDAERGLYICPDVECKLPFKSQLGLFQHKLKAHDNTQPPSFDAPQRKHFREDHSEETTQENPPKQVRLNTPELMESQCPDRPKSLTPGIGVTATENMKDSSVPRHSLGMATEEVTLVGTPKESSLPRRPEVRTNELTATKNMKESSLPPAPSYAKTQDILTCLCGSKVDTGHTICCDKCLTWQHMECMLLPYTPDKAPDRYCCERCCPEDHEKLLEAVAQGRWHGRFTELDDSERRNYLIKIFAPKINKLTKDLKARGHIRHAPTQWKPIEDRLNAAKVPRKTCEELKEEFFTWSQPPNKKFLTRTAQSKPAPNMRSTTQPKNIYPVISKMEHSPIDEDIIVVQSIARRSMQPPQAPAAVISHTAPSNKPLPQPTSSDTLKAHIKANTILLFHHSTDPHQPPRLKQLHACDSVHKLFSHAVAGDAFATSKAGSRILSLTFGKSGRALVVENDEEDYQEFVEKIERTDWWSEEDGNLSGSGAVDVRGVE